MAEIDLSAEEEAQRAECVGLARRVRPSAAVEVIACKVSSLSSGLLDRTCARAFVPTHHNAASTAPDAAANRVGEEQIAAATKATSREALADLLAQLHAIVQRQST